MTKNGIVASLVLFLLILVGGIVAFVFLKEDVWRDVALKAINDNISTEMVVDDVDVSFWSSFPQMSVDLQNVRIAGVPSRAGVDSDTLLSAQRLGVAFSLWEVLFGDPVIRSIYVENGAVILEEFPNGKWNYQIGSENQDSSSIEITSVHISQIDLTYIERGNEKSTGLINKAELGEEWLDVSFEDFKYKRKLISTFTIREFGLN